MAKRIRVIVVGGVVQDVENIPPGIEVVVADYDTDGIDLNLRADENGDRFVEAIYESEASPRKLTQIDISKLDGFEGGHGAQLLA